LPTVANQSIDENFESKGIRHRYKDTLHLQLIWHLHSKHSKHSKDSKTFLSGDSFCAFQIQAINNAICIWICNCSTSISLWMHHALCRSTKNPVLSIPFSPLMRLPHPIQHWPPVKVWAVNFEFEFELVVAASVFISRVFFFFCISSASSDVSRNEYEVENLQRQNTKLSKAAWKVQKSSILSNCKQFDSPK